MSPQRRLERAPRPAALLTQHPALLFVVFNDPIALFRCEDAIGDVPFILVINKKDLKDQWELPASELEKLSKRGWQIIETSAKTGEGIGDAFYELAKKMVRKRTSASP